MAVQTLTFPAITPSRSGFNIVSNTKLSTGAVNNIESVTENTGEKWLVTLRYNVLTRADGLELRSHLLQLRGHVNKTLITDTSHAQRGTWAGSPVINGANQYGLYADINGLTPNTLFGRAADRCKFGGRVHELTADAISDSTGAARIYVANEILNLTTHGEAIETNPTNLSVVCRWANPKEITQFEGNKSHFRNIKLTFMEALA